MTIRPMQTADIPVLRALYDAQGFDYPFPDLTETQFVERWVMVDEQDNPVQAVVARQTVELYFFADRTYRTPRWRFEAFRHLHEWMRQKAEERGLVDAHLWIPPQIEKSFARRLRNGFGWRVNRWLCLSRTTRRLINGAV